MSDCSRVPSAAARRGSSHRRAPESNSHNSTTDIKVLMQMIIQTREARRVGSVRAENTMVRKILIFIALLLIPSLPSYLARPEGQAQSYANAAVVSVDP